MTKAWTLDNAWPGATVAIFGNAPTMDAAAAAAARKLGYKTIAVNRAIQFAPWADMFVALDPHHPFWAAVDNFAGIKVSGVESDDGNLADAQYAGMLYETVTVAPGHEVQIRNNFLAAMRLAARMGAAKIVLIGVDAASYDATHAHTGFYGFTQGLAQVSDALQLDGVIVETNITTAKKARRG